MFVWSGSSSLNSSAPYTPSFDSSPFPSTVSPALKKAIVDAGLVSTAEWSPDGNSLTIKGNTVLSTDIGTSVYAGSPISSYDLPPEVTNAAKNFYSDLGLTTPQKYQSGLKDVSYDYYFARTAETAVIYAYLSAEIS